MQGALRAVLRGMPAVAALCAERVDWGKRPAKDPYPGICLHLIGDREGFTLRGSDGLSRGRVQIDCYAEDYTGAADLAEAVRLGLNGYRQGGFRGVFLESLRDNTERGSNEPDRAARVSMDFLVNWRESNA
jgi:hypothetical protein